MSAAPGVPRPEGWPRVIPRLLVPDPASLARFLGKVFAARVVDSPGRPSEVWIGDSVVLVSDGGGVRESTRSALYVYVDDVDACTARAIEAGATLIEPPTDLPYGDRRSVWRDPSGQQFQVATRLV